MGSGVNNDDRRANLCPCEQLLRLIHALQAYAAVTPAVAAGVFQAIMDALAATKRHEVGHVHAVQRADLVNVLGVDLERATSSRPGAGAIACAMRTFCAVPGSGHQVDLVVLQGNQLPRLDTNTDDLAVLAVVVPAGTGHPRRDSGGRNRNLRSRIADNRSAR